MPPDCFAAAFAWAEAIWLKAPAGGKNMHDAGYFETATRDQPHSRAEVLQVVGFKVGDEEFGLDILRVQEIIRVQDLTRVPNSPDFVGSPAALRTKRSSSTRRIDLPHSGCIGKLRNKNSWVRVAIAFLPTGCVNRFPGTRIRAGPEA